MNTRICYIQWNDWAASGLRVPTLWPSRCCNTVIAPRPESHNFVGVWDFSRACVAQLQICVFESVSCVQREDALLIKILGRVAAAISEEVIVICEASIVLNYVQLIYDYRVMFSLSPPRKRRIFSFPRFPPLVQNRTGWVAPPR